ncbi:MAG: hypothetical protein R2852_05070 [Bacteroidia bacterium]
MFLFKARKTVERRELDPAIKVDRILKTMQSDLRLTKLQTIRCFDNSNIQGAYPVAACVVFKNAKPSKSIIGISIKTVVGPDDFASMKGSVIKAIYQTNE